MIELDKITTQRAISGQNAAFKSLYDWYAPFIWRVVFKMTGDHETALELVQETFVKAHSSLKKFRAESSVSTWLYRIAYNIVMAHLSHTIKMRLHDSYEDVVHGHERSDQYEHQEVVQMVMNELTADERFLLVAREIDDLSFEELSSITGESSGALRTKLHRLKERIRDRFPQDALIKEAV